MELRKETREFRVESEEEAIRLIEEWKQNAEGRVDYKTVYKTKKVKGEVVDYWWIVQIIIDFTK